jgi:hypothetical protein
MRKASRMQDVCTRQGSQAFEYRPATWNLSPQAGRGAGCSRQPLGVLERLFLVSIQVFVTGWGFGTKNYEDLKSRRMSVSRNLGC